MPKKIKTKKIKIRQEFAGASLGDKRLDDRLLSTVKELNSIPSFCINAAMNDWKSKKAAYRFFDNDKSNIDEIMKPHFTQTKKRMSGCEYVYSIQDTSFIDFNKHKSCEGLGSIGRYGNHENHVQGLILHTSLAVSNNGLPLGLQSHEVWARPSKGHDKTDNERVKESDKWLRHFQIAKGFYNDNKKMIVVADREADIFDFLDGINKSKIDAVIRSKVDRGVKRGGISIKHSLSRVASCGTIVVADVRGAKNKKRAVTLDVKFTTVYIEVPGACQKRYPFGLECNVVEALELNPPQGEKALSWILLTTIDVKNFEDAKTIIKHYKMRWNIESYFKVLKSGCKIEDCRLETAERLIRYIGVMSIIAWRIYWGIHISRVAPDQPWNVVITKLEYQTLWARINKSKIMDGTIPKKPPPDTLWSAEDCIRYIAMLGGFNNRKSDGNPGMISIWRGWMRLYDMTEVAEALL